MTGSPTNISFDGDSENWDTEGAMGEWGGKDMEEPSKGGMWKMKQ